MLRPAIVLFLVACTLMGQTTGTATLTGAVTDASGSVVPGAKVVVTNKATGVAISTATTSEGTFYVPTLNPGTYRLQIEAGGFKQYVRDGLILRTAEMPRVDVQLEVGAVSESVNVSGAPLLLETETSASGAVSMSFLTWNSTKGTTSPLPRDRSTNAIRSRSPIIPSRPRRLS